MKTIIHTPLPAVLLAAGLCAAVFTSGCDTEDRERSGLERQLTDLQGQLCTSVQDRQKAEERAQQMAASAFRWQLAAAAAAGGCLAALIAGTVMGSAARRRAEENGEEPHG